MRVMREVNAISAYVPCVGSSCVVRVFRQPASPPFCLFARLPVLASSSSSWCTRACLPALPLYGQAQNSSPQHVYAVKCVSERNTRDFRSNEATRETRRQQIDRGKKRDVAINNR